SAKSAVYISFSSIANRYNQHHAASLFEHPGIGRAAGGRVAGPHSDAAGRAVYSSRPGAGRYGGGSAAASDHATRLGVARLSGGNAYAVRTCFGGLSQCHSLSLATWQRRTIRRDRDTASSGNHPRRGLVARSGALAVLPSDRRHGPPRFAAARGI